MIPALLLAGIATALAAASYVVYPVWIRRAAATAPDTLAPGDHAPRPSVEVLVAAADEEGVIAARVVNVFAQAYEGPLSLAIGCDGCRDGTASAARATAEELSAGARLRVLEFRQRRGKASVLNDLVAESRAELLVFTDANTRFAPDAVGRLAARFADGRTGAVCGRLLLEDRGGKTAAEVQFWDRETALKAAEGRLGICLGANGAIYAARRELVEPLPPDTTSMDDFLIPARIARARWRVDFAGDALAFEPTARDVRAEAARRFRIGIGAGQVLRRETGLLSPRRGPLALAFAFRKAARWLAPVFALLAALAALADSASRPYGLAALALAAVLLLSTLARPRASGLAGRLYYFGVMNLSLATGVLAGLFGARRPVWRPTAR